MNEFEAYEASCRKQKAVNQEFLNLFLADLDAKGLSEKTIRSHISNVDLYLNEYLLRSEIIPMEQGCSFGNIDDFIGYFFIRKCTWSTPATVKSTAASLKKFYKCMLEHGKITPEDYNEVTETIKDCMEDWQADCANFNDDSMSW